MFTFVVPMVQQGGEHFVRVRSDAALLQGGSRCDVQQ